MTAEQLEAIIAKNDGRTATAYAALTLTKVLAPEWTHRVKRGDEQVDLVTAAGCTFGKREDLEKRLQTLISELGEP